MSLTRRRMVDGRAAPSLGALLRDYVRARQRLLRAMRTGITLGTLGVAGAATAIIEPGAALRPLIVTILVALFGLSSARSGVRQIVLARPEAWAARLSGSAVVLEAVLGPVAALLRLPASIPLRWLGVRGTSEDVDPAEELMRLLEAVNEEDEALTEERQMLRGLLEMSGQAVRELMTPRLDVIALPVEATATEAMKVISRTGFSRVPLYRDTLDQIVGVVYAKDLLAYIAEGRITPRLTDIARPPSFVPDTKRADELLTEMRRDRVHLAVAVDEYGGTAGVVTVEDLVEEIVGSITDEYDAPEQLFERVSDTEALVDASLSVSELNDLFGTEIEVADADTVGGAIVTILGRLAVPGDVAVIKDGADDEEREAEARHVELTVISILGRRVKQVRVRRLEPSDERPEPRAEPVVS